MRPQDFDWIRELADFGLARVGRHGPIDSLGPNQEKLPSWDDIQILTAQLSRLPLLDEDEVATDVIIGPRARKPLRLEIPLMVADMAFGSLSEEAKTALAKGAEKVGAALCSGEAGVLHEEQEANSRYMVQMGTARWGYSLESLKKAQAFHVKFGQAAKTGTGGHLVGSKVKGRIAEIHGAAEGTTLIAPSRHIEWKSEHDMRVFLTEVRDITEGIPVGCKISAQHIEADLDVVARVGFDYVILDGRGGGSAASPLLFREHIGVPTIPALARARRHLDRIGHSEISLIVSGGLRLPADFFKALALGADAVGIGLASLQAIGCTGIRACHTDTCPAGIATQNPELRANLKVEEAADKLARYLGSSISLMKILARACGKNRLQDLDAKDLTSFKKDVSELAGIAFSGAGESF